MRWKDGRLQSAVLEASIDGKHRLRVPEGQKIVEIRSDDQAVDFRAGDNGTAIVDVKVGRRYEVTIR
jgi:hypothetical protein